MQPLDRLSGEFDRSEPIPGYRTLELLGRGGCGEVWKAIAPGGLHKAVKIVYGDGDASHAEAEQRALSRIRDVRHPMLLSIERIEVCQGNLIVVTELADGSLKQRFVEARDNGENGLPEDELLTYLQDVASALDFLYEKCSLQHLDVKPENILLTGGRAKLGDFGLIKNLYERSVSLVGGLTPTYAPPELFEGRPTRHSDQYSLALVYMQMLTGVLPFVATNAAQLAEQHLRGVPDLWALPRPQSTVVARALSKDPEQRYESCTAMMRALSDCGKAASGPAGYGSGREEAPAPGAAGPIEPGQRSSHSPDSRTASAAGAETSLAPAAQPSVEPVEKAGEDRQASAGHPVQSATNDRHGSPPLLLVAAGGSGVEVVARVIDRLRDHYGAVEHWPPVEILALDSNSRELSARFTDDVLSRVQVVPIPLAPGEQYGARAGEFLPWITRRWLYNIPRDQMTEGFRPLGRLALMTHADRVRAAIKSSVEQLKQHLKPAEPGSAADHPGSRVPRVMMIGSISGGTGGGSLIDLTYAIRSELKRSSLSDEDVHGVLLYSTPVANADRDKARAGAWATLGELFHFSRSGGCFPGEPVLGASPFHGDNATFSRTHVLKLGESLSRSQWQLATEHAADFLYCTGFSQARCVLGGNDIHGGTLARSYDVLALGADRTEIISQTVERAAGDVVDLWRTGRAEDSGGNDERSPRATERTTLITIRCNEEEESDEVAAACGERIRDCSLTLEQLLDCGIESVEQITGCSVEQYTAKLVEEILQATSRKSTSSRLEAVLTTIDHCISRERDLSDDGTDDSLYEQVFARLQGRHRDHLDRLTGWLRGLVDEPAARIAGARQHALAVRDLLAKLQSQVRLQQSEMSKAAAEAAVHARTPEGEDARPARRSMWSLRRASPDAQLLPLLSNYAEKRLEETLYRAINRLARTVDAEVTTQIEQFDRLWRSLNQLQNSALASTVPARESRPAGDEAGDAEGQRPRAMLKYQQLLRTELSRCREQIARQIETGIDQQLLRGEQGLQRFLDVEGEQPQILSRPLAEISRRTILQFIGDIGRRLAVTNGNDSADDNPPEMVELIAAGFQELEKRSAGGGRGRAGESSFGETAENAGSRGAIANRLAVLPDSADLSRLQEQVDAAVPGLTLSEARKSDVMLCAVHHPQPLIELADEIIGGVNVYRELGARLRTRSDISWCELTRERQLDRATPGPPTDSAEVVNTAVLPRMESHPE